MANARCFAFAFRLLTLSLLLVLPLAGPTLAQNDDDDGGPDTAVRGIAAQYPVFVPDPPKPALHGPRVVGLSPNRPLRYRIIATGREPLTFAATHLPAGMTLDPHSGLLSGKIAAAGTTTIEITIHNAIGSATGNLKLICTDSNRAATPPMGWNAFGIYGDAVDDAKVRDAVDRLVATGLAAHGYRYVCLGDAWQGARDADGNLTPNRRFPDMKALADYIHSRGLLFGIYSAATPQTCSGYAGSAGHEAQDAKTFASWGVDYLTYDWCPVVAAQTSDAVTSEPHIRTSVSEMKPAFTKMAGALAKVDRDIVYAVSVQPTQRYTYGEDDPGAWAAKAGADTFTLTGGVFDSFKTVTRYAYDRANYADSAPAGHWSDLGPLMAGRIGFPKSHLSLLTPNEQMTQMTMWAMLSSPLFISCDLDHLNANKLNHYTSALLTNDEVIAIDQDPPQQPVERDLVTAMRWTWTRHLSDGRVAVALFNNASFGQIEQIKLEKLGLTGTQPVRDLWQRRDLPPVMGSFAAKVPAHGVVFVVIGGKGASVAFVRGKQGRGVSDRSRDAVVAPTASSFLTLATLTSVAPPTDSTAPLSGSNAPTPAASRPPDDPHYAPVIAAILTNNPAKVSAALGARSPDIRAGDGTTPLMKAAGGGREAIVNLLIAKGADVNAAAADGDTPLLEAAHGGNVSILQTLLDRGAHIDAADHSGVTALMEASHSGNPDAVALLLSKGADLHVSDKSGFTPLMVAAFSSNTATMQLLLDRGADINARDKKGHTALMEAAYSGNAANVSLLLAHNAEVDANDSDGFTALMVASGTGNMQSVQALMAHGANVNAATHSGFTPLMQAASANNLAVMKLLFDSGADTAHRTGNGAGALLVAAYSGRDAAIDLLIAHGEYINERDYDGHTALMGAAFSKDRPLVTRLLDGGADPNAKTKQSFTPLMQAAFSGDADVVATLIDAGADVNAKNDTGLTPLMQAAGTNAVEAARALLIHGADILAEDNKSQTALDWARKRKNDDMIALLKSAGAEE